MKQLLFVLAFAPALVCAADAKPEPKSDASAAGRRSDDQLFQRLLDRYQDLPAAQFLAETPRTSFLEELSFNPTKAQYYERVNAALQLSEEERQIFRRNGFVSVETPGMESCSLCPNFSRMSKQSACCS
jgi:hypothetical protein